MTTRSANRTSRLILTSVPWMTGFFLMASALCGAHAEQHNPAKATTFGYVTNAGDKTVSVIDTASNAVVATIPVGGIPSGVATTPDGTRAYVTNSGEFDNTVSVIGTASNTVVATIPVGQGPGFVATTPDGTHAYVTSPSSLSVSVIDTASDTVVATIPLGVDVVADQPFGVAITPDGTRAYVTKFVGNTVSVIDTATNTVVATIPVGAEPGNVAVTPDGTHTPDHDDRRHQPLAYVTNEADNTVSVIDTANNTVVATIPVGAAADGVAFATVTPLHRQ
jgi:YVTN family beta-propeller protein